MWSSGNRWSHLLIWLQFCRTPQKHYSRIDKLQLELFWNASQRRQSHLISSEILKEFRCHLLFPNLKNQWLFGYHNINSSCLKREILVRIPIGKADDLIIPSLHWLLCRKFHRIRQSWVGRRKYDELWKFGWNIENCVWGLLQTHLKLTARWSFNN